MTRSSSLFEHAVALPALQAAWEHVKAAHKAGGSDDVSVDSFAGSATIELRRLHLELVERRYVPLPLRAVSIPKSNGERRTLHLPAIRDKIVQKAVHDLLAPRLDAAMSDSSYAYRQGRGAARAVVAFCDAIHRAGPWTVRVDVDDCFDTIPHDRLLRALAPHVPDDDLLELVALWCRIGSVRASGDWEESEMGVHQGNVVAPLLCNLYLTALDQSLESRGITAVRYADDIALACRTREEAEEALQHVQHFLHTRLALRLNDTTHAIRHARAWVPFLGVECSETLRRLPTGTVERAQGRLRALSRQYGGRPLAQLTHPLSLLVHGWERYYGQLLDPAALAPLAEVVTTFVREWSANARATGVPLRAIAAWCRTLPSLGEYHLAAQRSRRRTTGTPDGTTVSDPLHRAVVAVRKRRRRHLQSAVAAAHLHVATPGAFIGKAGDTVVVRHERRFISRLPVRLLRSVTIGSRGVSLSSDVIAYCAEHGVPLTFLHAGSAPAATLSAHRAGRTQVQLAQLSAIAAGAPAFELARLFVIGKLRNQRALLRYLHKYRKHVDPDYDVRLTHYLARSDAVLAEVATLSVGDDFAHARLQLMSAEGRGAAEYWAVVQSALRAHVDFPGRRRQGATDLVNALLNYGYAILSARTELAIARAGLLPGASMLHATQDGKATLAFDLMEEFRTAVVDRAVLALVCRGRPLSIDAQGLLSLDTRTLLADAIGRRLGTLVRVRDGYQRLELVIDRQATQLSRAVCHESRYVPYVART